MCGSLAIWMRSASGGASGAIDGKNGSSVSVGAAAPKLSANTRPAVADVIPIESASLEARLRASVVLAQQKKGAA